MTTVWSLIAGVLSLPEDAEFDAWEPHPPPGHLHQWPYPSCVLTDDHGDRITERAFLKTEEGTWLEIL